MVLKEEQYSVSDAELALLRGRMLPPVWGYYRAAIPPLRSELIFWLRLSQCNVDAWRQLKVTACSIAWCKHCKHKRDSWCDLSQLVNVVFNHFIPSNNIP